MFVTALFITTQQKTTQVSVNRIKKLLSDSHGIDSTINWNELTNSTICMNLKNIMYYKLYTTH